MQLRARILALVSVSHGHSFNAFLKSSIKFRQRAAHRRQIDSAAASIETLEDRMLLSATSVDDADQIVEYHDELVDAFGNVYDEELALPEEFAADPSDPSEATVPAATAPLSGTFLLHSNPGASHVVYLDFDGHVTSGTSWNGSFTGGEDIITPAYNVEGDSSFTDAELQRIQYIWQRVAEDFAPFDVDVTTEAPGADALSKSGSGDASWGVRIVIGGNSSWYGQTVGGLAYRNSFNWSSDTPAFVFEDHLGNGHEKYTAEAISHEVGHTLGLAHDGNSSTSYYRGANGWAPIMGTAYYEELSQWSSGEYADANNLEDDLAIITSYNGFGYRVDDHGDTDSSATVLATAGTTLDADGLIEQNTDVDVFSFTTGAGTIDIWVAAFERSPNLDILAELYDSVGNLIASSNPTDSLDASMLATVEEGQYFLQISGVGKGDPLNGGYSDYASLGWYSVSGNIVTPSGSFLAISDTDAVKSEGDSGSTDFTFTVTRSGDVSQSATVDFVVSGSGATAAGADDFVGGTYPGGTITFAAGEYSKGVTVQVRGDTEIEADEQFTVTLSNAAGAQITTATANGTILNDEVPPAIIVTPTTGLTTNEAGATATFSVGLNSRPDGDVIIQVTSLDLTEGTVDKNQLVFTADNWDVEQVVTVTGVDDSVRDGHVTFTVELTQSGNSSAAAFAALDPDDVTVTNQDNEKGKKGGKDGGGGGGKGGGKGGGPKKASLPTFAFSTLDDWSGHHRGEQSDTSAEHGVEVLVVSAAQPALSGDHAVAAQPTAASKAIPHHSTADHSLAPADQGALLVTSIVQAVRDDISVSDTTPDETAGEISLADSVFVQMTHNVSSLLDSLL